MLFRSGGARACASQVIFGEWAAYVDKQDWRKSTIFSGYPVVDKYLLVQLYLHGISFLRDANI